ncbi:MAG TPA: flagellar filament capping protein FliD [Fimbriimonadaceae bacterium]|nr:flagellar filament capping protein FliD [Fimbriimonadaceae bacterium]HRJ33194.1 flagellar filament capping protein FliD [Fimbriimonadaceae bacterium]
MQGISFNGIGSGLDTQSLIRQLISIEQIPIQRMQAQQRALNARMSAVDQFNSALKSLATSAGLLNNAASFNPVRANSSDSSVATISAGAGASAGVYQLEVMRLAQSQKIASNVNGLESTTKSLQDMGLWNGNGNFVINGKGISVAATDTLTTLAQKINSANAGVTASLIDGGAGKAYLSLTSNSTGEANRMQLSDVGADGVLSQLGIVSGAVSIREPIVGGAASSRFSSNSTALGAMTGSTGIFSGTVTVGTGSITVSGSDTLQSIADKINNPANGTGATALVTSTTENGVTRHRLEITGTTTFGNEGNFWQNLGVTQRAMGNTLVAAQDAEFKLDGVTLKSATNSVTTVIPGATLTLLKADVTTPPKTTLSMTRDNEQIKKNIKGFVEAFNNVVDYIDQTTSFNKETFQSGPLFGDAMVQQFENSISTMLFNNVTPDGAKFRNLTQLGFALDDKGKIKVDEAVLDKAIAEDVDAVSAVLRSTGSTTGADLSFIAGTNKTKSSSAAGYNIQINQAATKGSIIGAKSQDSANPLAETLTFNGGLFGNQPINIILNAGNDLAATIQQLNNDSRLKDLILAENDNGKLKITSKRFGSPGDFTVVSDQEADTNNSSIGFGGLAGTYTAGLNVAGTINGEAATGSGQLLTGNSGNENTEGLQIMYTGSATGNLGTVRYTSALASRTGNLLDSFTDTVNGLTSATSTGIKSQIDQLSSSIESLTSQITVKQETLRRKFAVMEQTLSQLQGQSNRLGAIAGRR